MKKTKQPTTTEPLPPLQEPEGTLTVRDSATGKITVTPEGLDYIEYLASEFCTITFIASKLGVSRGLFEKLLGKAAADPISDVRAAWEAGRGALETEVQRAHLALIRSGHAITPMFISKTEFGKREAGDPTINIGVDNRRFGLIDFLPTNIDPELGRQMIENAAKQGVLLLPDSHKTLEADMAANGQTEIVDGRNLKLPVEAEFTEIPKQEDSNVERAS